MATQTRKNKKMIAWICGIVVAVVLIIVAIVVVVASPKRLDESFFVSDGTKYVATLGPKYDIYNVSSSDYVPDKIYLVYFYSNDKVTDVKAYYKYSNESEAKDLYNWMKEKDNSDDISKVEIDGEYVIIVSDKSAYEDMTADDAKQEVEFMEMLERMSSGNIDEE